MTSSTITQRQTHAERGGDSAEQLARHSLLGRASAVFIVTWLVHNADHIRRGLDASGEAVVWSGTVAGLLAAIAITLVLSGHRSAPFVAAAVFLAIGVGVTATHLLPDWGPLSDPILVGSNSDGLSPVLVVPEILAAFWVGGIALLILRRNDYSTDITPDRWASTPPLATP